MKRAIAIIAVIGLVAWSGRALWYARAIQPVDENSQQRITVRIPAGSSTQQIAALLEDKMIIRSAAAFRRFVQKEDLASALQAGTFVLRPSMDAAAIADALLHGKAEEVSVTIPEGFTVRDIDALLAAKNWIEPGEFIDCALQCDVSQFAFLPTSPQLSKRGGRVEGYLFPDTYFVSTQNFSSEEFLQRMLQNFRFRVIDSLGADIASSTYSLQEIITMASLVEEETRTDAERSVVAGILWKRLREGMRLDVDAAVRYVVNKPTEAITLADLAMDSPYNLRLHGGLPPGPIASPGLSSIKATLSPQESPYYFYLHGTDGQIRYGVTNDDHNRNKARYLR